MSLRHRKLAACPICNNEQAVMLPLALRQVHPAAKLAANKCSALSIAWFLVGCSPFGSLEEKGTCCSWGVCLSLHGTGSLDSVPCKAFSVFRFSDLLWFHIINGTLDTYVGFLHCVLEDRVWHVVLVGCIYLTSGVMVYLLGNV